MNKLIFLDIDGVLNNDELLRRNIYLCSNKVSLLHQFCEQHDIKIVISSSWREIYSFDNLKLMLFKEGFMNTDRIIDVTPIGKEFFDDDETRYIFRGYEIEKWLSNQDIQYNYVILDDTQTS